MSEFFRGWRRKIAITALVMACVFTGAWVRSLTTMDSLTMRYGPQDYLIFMSGDQWIGYVVVSTSNTLPIGWESAQGGNPFSWINSGDPTPLLFPHAVFVLPLIAISAYLLLSKPNKVSVPAGDKPSGELSN